MGPFEFVRKSNHHVETCDCMLLAAGSISDHDRVLYILNTNPVNRDPSGIFSALGIRNFRRYGGRLIHIVSVYLRLEGRYKC